MQSKIYYNNELSKILTSIGLEVGGVETVQTIKGGLEGLVIGKVLTCVDHENSDHLHITTVDVGEENPLQIVCGAPNVAEGQTVVVATVGTTLYAGEDSFKIKKTKIRGVESFGMICAEDEIGVGASHDGIITLSDEIKAGTLAKDYYGVETDIVLEIDITPNRVDATSHYGVARDLAAYLSTHTNKVKAELPSVEDFKVDNTENTISVEVEDSEACPRYAGVTISGVEVKESPKWLKNRLLAIGLRPINNVVDVTNFVLHELGQPLHSFDADKITGNKVVVKKLAKDSPFTTLDEVERKLSDKDLMICNTEEPMCIAGVFGGMHSGVTDKTTNIFLESAYFNPVSIRKTARFHTLSTDSSFRFERGIDPNNTIYALKRAALLIKELAGGKISSDIVDIYPNPIKHFEVTLQKQKINSLIGKEIEDDIICRIFEGLEYNIVDENSEEYKLEIPPYRVDVQRDVDVIEDILRIYGYNNVENKEGLHSNLSYTQSPDSHRLQVLISEQLTAQGMNEILNNSLTKEKFYEGLASYPQENCVKIMNSLSNDLNVMRQTLLFGGLENISRNINHRHPNLKFYEFGNCYTYNPNNKSEDNYSAYSESFHLGIWITGNKYNDSWISGNAESTVYELKAYFVNILERLGIKVEKLKTESTNNELLSNGLVYKTRKGVELGFFGIVSNKAKKLTNVEADVYYADLNWKNVLEEVAKQRLNYQDPAKYPEVRRDFAFLLDENITFGEIEKIAYQTEPRLLKKVSLFDVYQGKNLEKGKKSYAVNFVLQDKNKTLTDKMIDAVMSKIRKQIEKNLGATLRH